MKKRYYTEEAYEQINNTIDQIDNNDLCPVKDFFGDLILRIKHLLKYYSVDDYQEDMQKWYDIVLDSHNTTKKEVKAIFEAVESVDSSYQDILEDSYDGIANFRQALNCLRDVISDKITLVDGKKAMARFLNDGANSLVLSYTSVNAKMSGIVLDKAAKEVIGDFISLGSGFFSLVTSKGVLEYTVNSKKFLDTFVATLYDLRAGCSFLVIPIGQFIAEAIPGVDLSTETKLDTRFEELSQAQEFMDTESVSDWLGGIAADMEETREDCPKDNPYYAIVSTVSDTTKNVATASEMVDIAVDAYELIDGVKDSAETIDGWVNGKEYSTGEFLEKYVEDGDKTGWKLKSITSSETGEIYTVKDSPADIIIEVIKNRFSDWTGLPTSSETDPNKVFKTGFRTAGTIWSYAEKYIPDSTTGQRGSEDWMDVFIGKNKEIGTINDYTDLVVDVHDMLKDIWDGFAFG